MDAKEAVAALQDAAGYEESLTQRTAGMTNMIWGIAAPLIFLTYAAVGEMDLSGIEWVNLLLWIPGVMLGGILTATLWTSHAVTLKQTVTAKDGWNHLGVNILIFLALAAAIAGIALWADFDWTMTVVMVIVNGLFAFIVARRESGASLMCSRHTTVGGAWMIVGGMALGWIGLAEPATSLAGAAIVAVGWAGSGLWTYVRS